MDSVLGSAELGAPVILGEPQTLVENENVRILVSCKVKGRFTSVWYKNGQRVPQHSTMSQEERMSGNQLVNFSLSINNFRPTDAGEYTFKVENEIGSARAVSHLDPPEVLNGERSSQQSEGMDIDEQMHGRDHPLIPGNEVEGRPRQAVKSETAETYRPISMAVAVASSSRDTRRASPLNQAHVPAKKVATCSPSTLATTQQVAPQIATIGSSGDGGDSNAEVLSVFECPVCLEYMLPPYLQCHSGHLVCGNCRPKLQCCPTCRGQTPNVRNLGLEKIANTVRFPCKFASSGCSLFFFHQDKVEHEETCEFRPYSCPCPGASCKWQGALTDVMDHLKKIHKSITTLQGEDIVFLATDINLPGAVDWVMMQSCFGFNFMLVLEKQDRDQGQQMFYAVVQLIGAKKEADNFMYRLELSTMRRRLAWEATPRSIHEGVAHAIQQSDCLAFDTSTAQLFAENGNLGINVTISMVTEPLSLSSSR